MTENVQLKETDREASDGRGEQLKENNRSDRGYIY